MNESASAKQQIVEKIKNSTNILVTVNTNPTVDELVAALGLTLLLDKLKKHTTAVVSGDIPPAIDFLEPGKTFENTVDSLRDFIIALDKEKADHLRYKVDGDVVKIFVTPYRTTITASDLDFSQGDYNVELVLALNVKNRDNLDRALVSHGRILHDATVATISLGEESRLGSIHWQDNNASSLSEMLVALSEALKGDKPLLDEQIATAFLTGIVAATDRFSNDRTSSRIMTMAAQLMAAGANQQLIAAKLESADAISRSPQAPEETQTSSPDGTTEMNENEPAKLERSPKPKKSKKPKNDGTLTISHQESGDDPAAEAEAKLAEQLNGFNQQQAPASPTLSVADLQADIKSASQEIDAAAEAHAAPQPEQESPQPPVEPAPQAPAQDSPIADMWSPPAYEEIPTPTFGGTLNATTEAAAEAKRQERLADRNRTILSHGGKGNYLKDEASDPNQTVASAMGTPSGPEPSPDPFAAAAQAAGITPGHDNIQPPVSAPEPLDTPGRVEPTLDEIDRQHRGKAPAQGEDDPRAAVEAAFGAVPFDPAGQPQANLGAQPFGDVSHTPAEPQFDTPPMPPMPDFSTLPPLPPSDFGPQPPQQAQQPEALGDIFGTQQADNNQPPQATQPPDDPTQFRIPGQ